MLLPYLLIILFISLPFIPSFFLTKHIVEQALQNTPGIVLYAISACLAVGLGFGLSSLYLFLWLIVVRSVSTGYVISEVLLCIGFTVLLLYLSLRQRKSADTLRRFDALQAFKSATLTQKIACFGFGMVAIVAMVLVAHMVLVFPHGGFDAWAIWNMRARFLFLSGASWANAFNPVMPHTDYPLLLPLTVMRGWVYVGTDTQYVPAIVAVTFTCATVGLLAFAVMAFRGVLHGFAAGAVLISTTLFLLQGVYQTADVPVAYYSLAALTLITISERTGNSLALTMAGAFSGLAAWTKNEGLLLIVVVAVSLVLSLLRRQPLKTIACQALLFGAGVLPVLALVMYFKVVFAPPNDLVSGQGQQTLRMILNVGRYVRIIGAIAGELIKDYLWLPVIFIVLISGGIKRAAVTRTAFIVVGLMSVGYFFVYVTTPLGLEYHLGSSLDRVMLQMWPGFLLASFSSMRLLR